MNAEDWKAEEARLSQTLHQVIQKLNEGEANYRRIQGDLGTNLNDYWENKTADFWDEAQRTEEVERQRSIVSAASQRRRQYRKMLDSPYFGRIDLKEAGSAFVEPIYIGIGALTGENNHEILTYDWRSPVAGVFYDFELGKVWYRSPAGRVDGIASLKRQYRIGDGHLEWMFDADVTINDELLQEILGKSVNDKMRTIVTSIQREQNQAIRDDSHRWLFVEGPAGSGKTSVALHRAAYWLYNERNAYTPKNILILSPNPIFSDYISNVLPELGEENVRRITFSDYIEHLQPQLPVEFQTWTQQMEEVLISSDDVERKLRLSTIRFKSSSRFLDLLNHYAMELEKRWVETYPDLTFRGVCFWSQDEWKEYFSCNLTYLPVARRMAKIRRLIQIRMRPMVQKLRQEKAQEIAATGEEVNEKTIIMLARLAAREELRPVVDAMERLTMVNTFLAYRNLFANLDWTNHMLQKWVPSDWNTICRMTIARLDQGIIDFADAPAFLYLHGLLVGFSEKKEIRHLIVDEGQDYTCMQYALLNRLFPRTAWTVLGDKAQAIHPGSSGVSFEEAGRILNANPIGSVKLTKSYRSTRPIQDFCRALLQKQTLFDSLERPGCLPQVFEFDSNDQMIKAIPELIEAWRREGWRSVGIICKTAREAKDVHQALASKMAINLIHEETASFFKDVVVIPSYLAKGLEFDAVLVWRADAISYGREEERRLFYVNCTRALHRLAFCFHDKLTSFIENVDRNLYQKTRLPASIGEG